MSNGSGDSEDVVDSDWDEQRKVGKIFIDKLRTPLKSELESGIQEAIKRSLRDSGGPSMRSNNKMPEKTGQALPSGRKSATDRSRNQNVRDCTSYRPPTTHSTLVNYSLYTKFAASFTDIIRRTAW